MSQTAVYVDDPHTNTVGACDLTGGRWRRWLPSRPNTTFNRPRLSHRRLDSSALRACAAGAFCSVIRRKERLLHATGRWRPKVFDTFGTCKLIARRRSLRDGLATHPASGDEGGGGGLVRLLQVGRGAWQGRWFGYR
eukprot:2925803-Pyramimonas_sp.AAC.2